MSQVIAKDYPLFLANKPLFTSSKLKVIDKFSGEAVTEVSMADKDIVEKAIQAAVAAATPAAAARAAASYERKAILRHCVQRFKERQDELALGLCIEAGKPIKDSKIEVTRLIDTFEIAAEESVRITGEVLPLDITPRAKGYRGFWKRVPKGPCIFITPFNFPLNLVAHKVAAAIAVGCPFVLKPATLTPVGALIIGEVLAETNLPEGAFSILPCDNKLAESMVVDDRFKHLSFTGSASVGWALKSKAGKKTVTLELGGNAACVIDQGTEIDSVIDRLVTGIFYQSGQSCISVQRILIHESIYEEVKEKLLTIVRSLKWGDPKDPNNFMGPMISEKEATRLFDWIKSAQSAGATVLCGGKREGNFIEPTLLEKVPLDEKLNQEEAFGPVAILIPFKEFDQALDEVNRSRYGLQTGIFTQDLYKTLKAWDTLQVGGVIIGDVPSWRVDHMPYGGSKDSGIGREGIRFTIEELTEIRLLAIRNPE